MGAAHLAAADAAPWDEVVAAADAAPWEEVVAAADAAPWAEGLAAAAHLAQGESASMRRHPQHGCHPQDRRGAEGEQALHSEVVAHRGLKVSAQVPVERLQSHHHRVMAGEDLKRAEHLLQEGLVSCEPQQGQRHLHLRQPRLPGRIHCPQTPCRPSCTPPRQCWGVDATAKTAAALNQEPEPDQGPAREQVGPGRRGARG